MSQRISLLISLQVLFLVAGCGSTPEPQNAVPVYIGGEDCNIMREAIQNSRNTGLLPIHLIETYYDKCWDWPYEPEELQ